MKIKNADEKFKLVKEILLVLLLAILAASIFMGCAMGVARYTITDPSHLRVLLRNESPYKVRLEGAVTGWLGPRESIVRNMGCAGRFDGVAHAYKIIGDTDKGENVGFYMGEQVFSFRTDGYNYTYYGESYDDVVVISSFYKYPNMPLGAEKTHYPFYAGPCGSIFLPDVQFKWGK